MMYSEVALIGAAGVIFFWVLPALGIVPYVAHVKGYPWMSWLLIALIFSPILALLAIAALPDRRSQEILGEISSSLSDVTAPTNPRADRLFAHRPSAGGESPDRTR